MIEHVYRRACLCRQLDRVVIATPDEEIVRASRAFGAEVVMTSASHERATDRVAEAAIKTGGEVIVMIQGDEPLIRPEAIEAVITPVITEEEVFCANLVERIASREDFENPNTIKVAMDRRGNALYFSRSAIPSCTRKAFEDINAYKQVCVIPFLTKNLLKFNELRPTDLEEVESVDMLRVLEHGYTIRLVEKSFRTHAVDVPDDVPPVERLMSQDPISGLY